MHAQPSAAGHGMPSAPAPGAPCLLTIPLSLVVDLSDTPLAIGLYCLIARQFIIRKTPTPLSAPDIQRYDPALSRGAVLRALARLVQGGWLVEQRQAGHKTSYAPSWGRVQGAPRAWQIGQPILGRPRRMVVVRVDQHLLDICIGKLTPHPLRSALVERYLAQPALGLADIGAYALASAGYGAATPALLGMGLVQAGRAQPAPAGEQLLARASQLALAATAPAGLNERGLRRLGCAAPAPAEPAPQPLFFVEKTMIGSLIDTMIDSMIGQQQCDCAGFSAPECPSAPIVPAAKRSHGLERHEERQADSPPTPLAASGGGAVSDLQRPAGEVATQRLTSSKHLSIVNRRSSVVTSYDTPAAEALRAIHVLPAQIAELAQLPLGDVQAAIADARARPGVRDLAGWVVALLRNHREHGLALRPPACKADAPEALGAFFAQLAAQAAPLAGADPALGCDLPPTAPDNGGVGAAGPPGRQVGADAPAEAQIAGLVLGQLRMRLPHREWLDWGRRVLLARAAGGVLVLLAPSLAAKAALEASALAGLRAALGEALGAPVTLRVVLVAR